MHHITIIKFISAKHVQVSPPNFWKIRQKATMLKKNVIKTLAQYNISLTYPTSPLEIPMYVGKYHR
jgi:hypothetical protein